MATAESIILKYLFLKLFGIYIIFFYNLLVGWHYWSFIGEFNNLIYLSIIYNGTWQARIVVFYAFKTFLPFFNNHTT